MELRTQIYNLITQIQTNADAAAAEKQAKKARKSTKQQIDIGAAATRDASEITGAATRGAAEITATATRAAAEITAAAAAAAAAADAAATRKHIIRVAELNAIRADTVRLASSMAQAAADQVSAAAAARVVVIAATTRCPKGSVDINAKTRSKTGVQEKDCRCKNNQAIKYALGVCPSPPSGSVHTPAPALVQEPVALDSEVVLLQAVVKTQETTITVGSRLGTALRMAAAGVAAACLTSLGFSAVAAAGVGAALSTVLPSIHRSTKTTHAVVAAVKRGRSPHGGALNLKKFTNTSMRRNRGRKLTNRGGKRGNKRGANSRKLVRRSRRLRRH